MNPEHLFVRTDDPPCDLEKNAVPYSELSQTYSDPFSKSPVGTATQRPSVCTPPLPPLSQHRGYPSPPRFQRPRAQPPSHASTMTRLPEFSRFPQFSPTKQQTYSSPGRLETYTTLPYHRSYTISCRQRDGSHHPVTTIHTKPQSGLSPASPAVSAAGIPPDLTPVNNEQDPLLPLAIECIRSLCVDADRPRGALTPSPIPTHPAASRTPSAQFLQVPQITVTDNTRDSTATAKTFYAFREFGWLLEYIGAEGTGRERFPAMTVESKASFMESCAREKVEMAVRSARATLLAQGAADGGVGEEKGKIIDKLEELQAFFSETESREGSDGEATAEEADTTLRGGESGKLDTSLDRSLNFSRPLRVDIPASTRSSQTSNFPSRAAKDGYTDIFAPRLTQDFGTGGLDLSDVVKVKRFSFEHVEHPSEDHDESEGAVNDSFTSDTSEITATLGTERPRRTRPPVPINSIRLSRWPCRVDPKYLSRPADWTPVRMQVAPAPFAPQEKDVEKAGESWLKGAKVKTRGVEMVRWMFVFGFICPVFWIIGGWWVYPSSDKVERRQRPKSNTRSQARSTPHTSVDFETGTPFIPITPNRSSYPFRESVSSPTALLGQQSTNLRGNMLAHNTQISGIGSSGKESWWTHEEPMVRYCRHAAIVAIPGMAFAAVMLVVLFVFIK
ncbi:hypothetical protein L202_02623 [Cryptococcus amylolentus CBS 6039]|uniref:Uncharacterized protein n=1 Tax=Cryptococcus amylolentus CBS 6039 TaxID=1295533 RepID=A0A1E3HVK4_9TREE|nr:hypothetical protein L202_02623 [Cryptococcus amylolentus CBS 6039]ODN80362.1 hypothetical protein L202_02623 [Cryptococcus amylolentus CBS 6039]